MVHVAVPGVGLVPQPPHAVADGCARRALTRVEEAAELGLDGGLGGVGQLEAAAAKSLTPLSENRLCEADTTAAGHPRSPASHATPGVGRTPRSTTSAPSLAIPADNAAWSRGPDLLVSRPTRKHWAGSARAAARPSAMTNSAPNSALATPRMPSVPNRSPTIGYRLEYWGALRAFFRPYFLLSFSRASRVSRPAFLSVARSSGLSATSERVIPRRMAPAWPDTPPPAMVASMS